MSPLVYSLANERLVYESDLVKIEKIELISITPKESSVVQKVPKDIKELIAYHFSGNDAKIAYAIIKAESHGNPRAVGYNCFYTEDGAVHTERVKGARSTFCKKGHEKYSWSIDCGKIQKNFPGRKTCPEYAYDPEWSIAEMKRLHNERGWKPWVTYTSGKYLAYME